MNLNDIYTELIMEHNSNSHNKKHLDNPHHKEKGHNPSCGDEIEVEIIFDGDTIKDLAFTGHGCAISQASTSIMIDLVKGKTKKQALELTNKFIAMIKREITDESELEALEEAIAFKNISNMPARVKCAVIAWYTLKECIKE